MPDTGDLAIVSFSLPDLINHERAPGVREKEDVESLAEDHVLSKLPLLSLSPFAILCTWFQFFFFFSNKSRVAVYFLTRS